MISVKVSEIISERHKTSCGKTSVLLRRFYASVLSLQEQFRLLQCGFR